MTIEAELKRRAATGELTDWRLNPDGTEAVADDVVRARLLSVMERLALLAEQGTLSDLRDATRNEIYNRLTDIFHAVDGLEVTAGNIEINSQAINLQTDEVEALLRTLRDTLALETGQASRHSALSFSLTEIQSLLTQIRTSLTTEDFVQEAAESGRHAALLERLTEIRTSLATLVDSVYRRTDPLPGGTNMVGRVQLDQAASHFVSPSTSLKVEQQRFFILTSGRISLTASGYVRGVLVNPAGSGKTVRIVRLAGFASQGPAYMKVLHNPTSGTPDLALTRRGRNANRAAVTLDQSVTEMRVDVDPLVPMGGGIDLGWEFGLPGGQRVTLDLPPLVLPQGTTLGINIPFTGAADVTVSVYFFEE